MLPVPRGWQEVTPAWMTQALARRAPGAVVERVDVSDAQDGTNAHARVRLTYRAGTGPPSVFVKLGGRVLHRLALCALRAWATEARLARSGADLPLERPLLYAGGIDRARLSAVVVMDDVVAAGGRPHGGVGPLTVEQVRAGLRELAYLHAAWWARPLPPALGFLRPWRLGPVQSAVSVASLARGMHKLATLGAPPVPAGAVELGRRFRQHSVRQSGSAQRTVLHGDPHPANTYATAGGGTGFLDWQLARTGHFSHDLGYFLAGSLDPVDRRMHEKALIAGYLNAFEERSDDPAVTFHDIWRRYCETPAFGLATWVHTLSFGTFQPDAVCLATIRRFAAAYEDLR